MATRLRGAVTFLLDRGAKVRAISRHLNTAGLPDGAEVVQADPSQPDSLHTCFDGVTAIFLNARAVQTAASEVLTVAKRAGAVRAVALAAANVDEDHARQPSRWRGDFNAELEQAVIASGLEWVSLRPNEYASNFLGLWAAQLRSGNVIRAPYGASQHAPIDERDIAAVAVEALLTDRLLRQKVPLTGPRSQTGRELANTLAEALGRPIGFEEVSPEVARQGMLAQGFPEGFVTGYLLLQAEAVDRPATVTQTLEEILGRPATDVATWAVSDPGRRFDDVFNLVYHPDYDVPSGAAIMLSPFYTHRHPDFWTDPDTFDPDRWARDAETTRHGHSYHPFAAGPRICIGNNFSLLESHLLLAILARRFRPRLPDGFVPHFVMHGTLSIEGGLLAVIETHSD